MVPGTEITIWHFVEPPEGPSASVALIPRIRVENVGQPQLSPWSATVTLLVTPEQAEKLAKESGAEQPQISLWSPEGGVAVNPPPPPPPAANSK
ncbi:MAG TPA: hypothetical protein VG013_05335 [Gemmataceae bacterium]|jgi:hypothetical protein|nr:hypothetical protein [Gemmataceae bacterium]